MCRFGWARLDYGALEFSLKFCEKTNVADYTASSVDSCHSSSRIAPEGCGCDSKWADLLGAVRPKGGEPSHDGVRCLLDNDERVPKWLS